MATPRRTSSSAAVGASPTRGSHSTCFRAWMLPRDHLIYLRHREVGLGRTLVSYAFKEIQARHLTQQILFAQECIDRHGIKLSA